MASLRGREERARYYLLILLFIEHLCGRDLFNPIKDFNYLDVFYKEPQQVTQAALLELNG